jgi:branched-chain amino acid transport system permease protein
MYRTALQILAFAVVFAVFPSLNIGNYLLRAVTLFLLYLILAQSWNILGGYGGQISLGNSSFFGIGGYAAGLFIVSGLSMVVSIVMGGLIAAVLAFFMIPAFRLRGAYFAILTLFLGAAMQAFVTQLAVTMDTPATVYLPIDLISNTALYYEVLIVAVLTLVLVVILQRSKIIYALSAIKADEDSAESLGINTTLYKTIGLFLMSLMTGIAGGLYVAFIGFADPYNIFDIQWAVYPLFMTIVGGIGSYGGPIIGAAIFAIALQWLVAFVGTFSLLSLAVLLVVIVLTMPNGIINIFYKFKAAGDKTRQ